MGNEIRSRRVDCRDASRYWSPFSRLTLSFIIRFDATFSLDHAWAVVIIIIISSRGPWGSVTLDDVVDGPGAEARYLKEATALKAQV